MILSTNKGDFKVRYTYAHKTGPRIVVNIGNRRRGPFMGKIGDEIPFTPEARAKYQASIK